MKIQQNFELSGITTFHLPAKCSFFVSYDTEEELKELLKSDLLKNNDYMQIGGGSNLVFTKDYNGTILDTNISFIKQTKHTDNEVFLEVGAGVVWDDFVKYCVLHNYCGAENMSYIPGKVGASAVQNIGSYGAEVKDIITVVRAISVEDQSVRLFSNEECNYAYRDSIFKNELKGKYIVTSVEYRLSKTPCFNLEYGPLKKLSERETELSLNKIRDEIISIRCSKLPDPKYIGSVGSFFKNPIVSEDTFTRFLSCNPDAPYYELSGKKFKIPAGWLIEHCGLKGYMIGGARVWDKQCLVIANTNNATGSDVEALYKHIINCVKKEYGIELSPEANII